MSGDRTRELTDELTDRGRRARRSTAGQAVARTGLASRALVYLVLAVLTVQLATGRRTGETDQGGALQTLARHVPGRVALWALVAGAACYVAWRGSVAAFGTARSHRPVRDRLQAGLEGACYVPLGVMAVQVLISPRAGRQSSNYRSLSARAFSWPGGPLLVALVGLVVVGVGLFLASQGVRRSWTDDLHFGPRGRACRPVVVGAGFLGSVGRGLVFALAGVLVVVAAVRTDPSKAGGIDSALRTLAGEPYGPAVLVLSAVGFAAFAVFAVGESVWRVT